MSKTVNAYCRLCSQLKPSSKLTDLQTEKSACSEIITRLIRLNCQLDFKDSFLPKTVCVTCINSLNRAFAFVIAIERAQMVLTKAILPQTMKKEIDNSNSQNRDCKPLVEKLHTSDNKIVENVTIKTELDIEETIVKTQYAITLVNDPKLCLKQEKRAEVGTVLDVSFTIPPSPVQLSWKDYTWKCRVCETQFPEVYELISHSMTFHKICNAYSCHDCKLKKRNLDRFLTHVSNHRTYLKLSCYKCHMRFLTIYDMYKHKTEHKESTFKCNGCNSYFPSSEALKTHTSIFYKQALLKPPQDLLPSEKKQKQRIWTCLKCKKQCKSKSLLKRHSLIHTDQIREHTCEICGKCFLHKQSLDGHLMMHTDKRPYQCKICKHSFRTKYVLSNHMGVHDSAKPFSCEICGKCFRLERILKTHSIIHTDSFPHACTYCSKRFRFKNYLKIHIRQHTGLQPYSCDVCQRNFTNWPNYNKHMKCRHRSNMAKNKKGSMAVNLSQNRKETRLEKNIDEQKKQ